MAEIRPQPKPVKRVKKRKPLRARKPIERKTRLRAGKPRPAAEKRETAYRRRKREQFETGRMMFAKTFGCDVALTIWTLVGEIPEARDAIRLLEQCNGPIEYMHLGSKRKNGGWHKCDDEEGASGCRCHHRAPGIDGGVGGKARWYMALDVDGQALFKKRLIQRQQERWDALTDEQRANWGQLAIYWRDNAPSAA